MEMTQEHKEALARGRKEARAIKAYLKTVDTRRSAWKKQTGESKIPTIRSIPLT